VLGRDFRIDPPDEEIDFPKSHRCPCLSKESPWGAPLMEGTMEE
jgi:hypothetical protein